MGIKGPSVLALHPPIDIAKSCCIDSLHALYLGVSLKLLHLWFDKKGKSQAYNIQQQVQCCTMDGNQ